MSMSTADVTVGLDNRLKRYSAVAITVATLPVAGVTHAVVVDGSSVTSKKFTVEEGIDDSYVVSWLYVDLDHDLASTGKDVPSGADVLLVTKSDFVVDGAPKDDLNKGTAEGEVLTCCETKVFADADDEDFASRFPDIASATFDLDGLDTEAGLFVQGFEDGSPAEKGNFLPGSGSGLLTFAQLEGPNFLQIQVNEDFTITAFGVTAVPEPTTWALMALGVAGMAGVRRATRKPAR